MNFIPHPMDLLQPPGRPVTYFPALNKITGSSEASILLTHLLYATPREPDRGGWVLKSQDEWLTETGFMLSEFRSAETELIRQGLVEKHSECKRRVCVEEYNSAIRIMMAMFHGKGDA